MKEKKPKQPKPPKAAKPSAPAGAQEGTIPPPGQKPSWDGVTGRAGQG